MVIYSTNTNDLTPRSVYKLPYICVNSFNVFIKYRWTCSFDVKN